jgi:hypothetical protein
MAALGLRGKQIGSALKFLLDAVIDEQTENERGALVALAERTFCNE